MLPQRLTQIQSHRFGPKVALSLATILISFLTAFTLGQSPDAERTELGYPNFRIHTTQEIGTTLGSRFVTIDTNGRILYSSEGELSAYDGTQWNRISIPVERSNEDLNHISLGPDGVLYASGLGYWGKLVVNDQGKYVVEFFSDEETRRKASIEYFDQIAFAQGYVFFKGLNSLVRWHPEHGTRTWNEQNIDTLFEIDGTVFITSKSGLSQIEGDEIVPFPSELPFDLERGRIMQTTPWFDDRIALFHTDHSLILFDGQTFEDLDDDLESLGESLWSNDMEILDDETFAISLFEFGLVLINRQGQMIMRLDQTLDHRFLDTGKIAVAPDKSLWVTLSDGVAQITPPYPITYFDQRHKVALQYFDHARLGKDLMIRSSSNLHLAQYSESGKFTKFRDFEHLAQQTVYEMIGYNGQLIVSTDQGVYRLRAGKPPEFLLDIPYIYRIHKMRFGPQNRFVLSNSQFNYITELENDRLTIVQKIPSLGLANKILDDKQGNIWLERGISNVGRIHPTNGAYSYQEYSDRDGLTTEQWIPIWQNGNEVLFSSRKGPLRFNQGTNRFDIATEIADIIPGKVKKLTRPAFAPNGDFWVLANENPVVMRKQPDGSYLEDNSVLQHLGRLQIDDITFENDIAWLTSKKTLTRIDNGNTLERVPFSKPQINAIHSLSEDKILYHFARTDLTFPETLNSDQDSLQIDLSTPNYLGAGGIKYQYRLSGYNEQWSDSIANAHIVLDRIPSGNYTFEVKAIFADSIESEATTLPITVIPPIYRTLPAYVAYSTLALAAIWLLLKIRHLKLLRRQRQLEDKVVLQTKALRDKNIQLHGAFLSERELKKKAEKANLVKSEFLAMVSHEIRTPMNCIIGMADNLLGTSLEKEQFEMLQSIHSSGQSLVAIISDILDFSKIEAGKIVLEQIPFSPTQTVKDVFNLFVRSCDEKNISLKTEVEEGIPEVAIGDPVRLKQVLINLVGNARKFTQHGLITISLRVKAESENRSKLFFTVKDTGVGIEPEKMDILFKAFSQIDSSNTRKYGGTGLGLAISKRLVNLMDGDIGVSSQLGQGSTFSFSILLNPATPEQVEQYRTSVIQPVYNAPIANLTPKQELPRPSSVSTGEKDVLLVEDNPINQQVTAMMLRRIGYSCDIANNGEHALKIAAKKSYQVILMDIQMPEMDGIQCTKRMLDQLGEKTPPIIAVTAKSSDLDREVATEAGMCGFLTKPLERPKLKESIEQALSNGTSVSKS
ncbi:hybrid sensor histidine kinase/response regulator [Pelagicoccus mobilis]|uniref:Sensory/regulatory protein RpfC n=1 Tax=Pelagicoccus mobilis TaxID=415221 RepID=A0A934RR64_9BACT|nr:ATP-binding protein [Pelagicoccus mobilis]MBK1875387.1 response regulator [Pelagicoccus mobilis]